MRANDMVNGVCTTPAVCPGGAAGSGTVVPPVTTPVSNPVPTVTGQGNPPQAGQGGVPTPAVIPARPTALPFTGSSSALIAEGAALLLLLGAGLVVAARRKAAGTA